MPAPKLSTVELSQRELKHLKLIAKRIAVLTDSKYHPDVNFLLDIVYRSQPSSPRQEGKP